MGLYATREEEVDDLLRREVLVDLFAVVRQALRTSYPTYSLKKVEALLPRRPRGGGHGRRGLDPAVRAVARDRRRGAAGGDSRLQRGGLPLHAAPARLAARAPRRGRVEFGRELAWFEPEPPREVTLEAEEAFAERERLRAELLADLPDDPNELSEDERPRYLAAHLLDYHRREAKPVWWAFFDRLGRARPSSSTTPRRSASSSRGLGAGEAGAVARPRVQVPGAGAQAGSRRRRVRPGEREEGRDDPGGRRRAPAARARALARGGAAAARADSGRAVRHEAPARGARAAGAFR